ncbi:MAG: SpoIIE family protein phosphatase [Candidatus Riflebacteria bacterium]|nr:SpoIIE family protein phosphatase [Candidatus Riflebacteria bacterium]
MNAGQCYPLRLDPAGEITTWELPNFPLGLRARWAGAVQRRSLQGTTLLLYSDCLVEAKDATGEPVGYERFEALLAQADLPRAAEPLEALFAAGRRATGPTAWDDDATAVVVRRVPRADRVG